MKKSIRPVLPVLVLLLLLSHPSLSFSGAKNGLLLWFNVVLPTLLPFMLCSSLLVAWGGIPLLVKPLRPLFSLLRLSPEGSYCLLAGLLCGYPMGAKTTADFLREQRISQEEARRLLAICGFPSPMFVTGYLRPRLPEEIPFFFLLLALYLPVFLTGAGLGLAAPAGPAAVSGISAPVTAASSAKAVQTPFDELLMNSLEIMVKIGGFMMLYSILAAFLEAVPEAVLSPLLRSALLGFTEMTTGIEYASRHLSGLPAAVILLASAAFGGLSGVSQTQAVIKNAGLSIRHYVRWKLIHASLACAILILLSSLQQPLHLVLPPL